MRRLASAAVAVLLAGGMAACGEDAAEPLVLDTEPTSEASATPTESPTTGDEGPIPTSYPDAGLEFSELPEATGEERKALEAYVAYERGLRLLSHQVKPNKLLTDHAGPEMITLMESTLDYLRSNDLRYEGTTVISVSFDGAGARAAVLDLCIDASDLSIVRAGKEEPIEGLARPAGRAVVTNLGGTWKVTQHETLETSC